MKYTKHFAFIIKEHGWPQMDNQQCCRLFNIVAVENRIAGLNIVRSKLKGTKETYKYDVDYFNLDVRMADLTGRLTPEDLLKEMFRLSTS